MNKKIISVVTLAAVLAGTFSGCNLKKNPDSVLSKDNPVTITVWNYYNGVQLAGFDDAVEEFNNTVGLEKGIIVEGYSKNSVSELADSVVAAVKKDSGADTPPDIFETYVETAYVVDQLDGLADMSKYFTEKELDEYFDNYIEEGEFSGDGSLKIFPTAKSTEVMMINATDWQKFADSTGVTTDDLKTWESLVDVSEKYYNYTDDLTLDVPNDGKAFFGRDSIANYMVIGAKQLEDGWVTVDKDGNNAKLNIDKETIKKLWENYYVPYVKGYFTSQGRFRSEDMKVGTIISMICSTTGAMYCPTEVTIDDDNTYPIDIDVLPIPNFDGKDPYIVQQGAGMSVIKSDEKHEYASAVFLKWFTEKERNIDFSIESGYLPVKKDACNYGEMIKIAEDGGKEISDVSKDTLKLAIDEIKNNNLYTMPLFKNSTDIRTYIGDHIQETAKDAHDAAYDRINKGEDRDTVFNDYVSDDAFESWYETFCSDMNDIMKKK